MRWSLLAAIVLPGGVLIGVLYWLAHRHTDGLSEEWLAEQHRHDVQRSAEFEGVCWRRPYNQHLDACGWFNRATEQARRRVG